MTREDIIRMAQEAGFERSEYGLNCIPGMYAYNMEIVERFAALVEQHLIASGYRKCAKGQRTTQFCGMLEDAVKAEREACARVCEVHYDKKRVDFTKDPYITTLQCAAAIRARGEGK